MQTNRVLPYFHEKTKESIGSFIETSRKEEKVVVFWTRIVSNYNTLFTIGLSALLVIPSSGGSLTNLVFFTMLSGMISSQSQAAELLLQQIMKAEVSFRNVERLRRLPARQGQINLESVREVRFEKAGFSYGESYDPVITDVSCILRAGDHVRLTGGNGSGKSTFIKLITGIYHPSEGHIFINGRDISDYSQESLNRQILYINQDETLLNETMLTYLKIISGENTIPPEIEELFDEMGLSDKNRVIENGGLSLSVGQRKKLLIMKMLLRSKEASVIILDELEAGLDAAARVKYREYIKKLFSDGSKTVIMIEHEPGDDLEFNRVLNFVKQAT